MGSWAENWEHKNTKKTGIARTKHSARGVNYSMIYRCPGNHEDARPRLFTNAPPSLYLSKHGRSDSSAVL